MASFLSSIINDLLKDQRDLPGFTFILPSRRAGAFLRKEVSLTLDKPVFSPGIYSIEEFTEKISALSPIDNTTSLFELYSVYEKITPLEELEDFETFSTWAQTLIHDFNEIDRYLIPPEKIFNYLSEIQDINHWSLTPEKTQMVTSYLAFWKKLPQYYQELKANLLQKEEGYQGLIYRTAAENIESLAPDLAPSHIFIGFNALNNAEQKILQIMLQHGSRVFWDIDEVHFNDPEHDAGLFIREYVQNWPFYQSQKPELISTGFATPKEIEIIGIPKSVGQAKYVGEIINSLSPQELQTTALVLGEESLLLPVLNSLPKDLPAINITMGYPLKYSSLSYLFEKLFEFYKSEDGRFYYKDVISILSNSVIQRVTEDRCKDVISTIKKENLLYLNQQEILELFREPAPEIINYIFPDRKPDPYQALQKLILIINELKTGLAEARDALNLEILHKYHHIILQLEELLSKYPHIKSISSLHHFYKEVSSQQTLDFQGNSFEGLQLMGMLESRVLDFETVILTSVDEGILPAGKSTNSYIPYELKKTFGLPTYKEKDAVYTYHFYHLLQRAKKVFLLHNTDTESQMGGEKSRFLIQMEMEKQPLHKVTTKMVIPEVKKVSNQLQEVQKTPEIMNRVREIAEKGFSPSALTTYIRNPLDFYLQYILGIRDKEDVEETVAYNTLGTVVHQTLENFYKPLVGKNLTEDDIAIFRKKAANEVKRQFEIEYRKSPLTTGKNLLIFEVAKRYVINFLKLERKWLQEGTKVEIKAIEANLTSQFPVPELNFPVRIRGNVDRVDLYNDVLRIIDYKTGKVSQPQLEICEWDELTTDYDKYSKPFQVLMYATMLLDRHPTTGTVEAGVISFKNLKEGFLKFGEKESSRARKKNCTISTETIENFKVQLKNLILEICDPKIPFLEKEIKSGYGNY